MCKKNYTRIWQAFWPRRIFNKLYLGCWFSYFFSSIRNFTHLKTVVCYRTIIQLVWVYCLGSTANSILGNTCIPVLIIFLTRQTWIRTSTRKESRNNKAHSPGVSHRFVGNLLGADVKARTSCVYCRKASKANTAAGSWYFCICTAGKENEEEKVWLLADVRHLFGRLKSACLCVCVCLCVSGLDGRGGVSCCHFLLGSLVYVCPLAWTPVRSFLMISFTVEETKREILHSDQYVFHYKIQKECKETEHFLIVD